MKQKITEHSYPPHHAEEILVIKREFLFKDGAWAGLKKANFDEYLKIITDHQEFHPRYAMETDPTYKQIIPYLVFRYQDRYFLMERDKKASEVRLASKLTLGIGGHINKEDLQLSTLRPFENLRANEAQGERAGEKIFTWAIREFHEEVTYTGNLKITPLGILNDDSNLVGQVHIGFVFLLEGDSDAISIKSELASGTLVTLDECKAHKERMEGWSQTVLESLI